MPVPAPKNDGASFVASRVVLRVAGIVVGELAGSPGHLVMRPMRHVLEHLSYRGGRKGGGWSDPECESGANARIRVKGKVVRVSGEH